MKEKGLGYRKDQ